MEIDNMLNQQGAWLRGIGKESDIVISSRIRLARNIAGFPFVNRATEKERLGIIESFENAIKHFIQPETAFYLDLQKLSTVDCYYLLERQLISQDFVESTKPRAVLIDRNEDFSIMVNEEDHLRLQAMTSGLDLEKVWACINLLDDKIANELSYAFDEKLGYLTACPTNTGTGIRVSVMLHLPGLVETKEIERVFRSLQKINLAVRGTFGEGSKALGDFYQISNQITLGRSEEELIAQIAEVIPCILKYERKARSVLMERANDSLMDRCFRAMGILQTARTISAEESMNLLSSVRLGINMGIINDISCSQTNDLLLHLQPAHLQKLAKKELNKDAENHFRADYLRQKINLNVQS